MKNCVIEGCEEAPKGRGLCNKHYVKAHKDGTFKDYTRTKGVGTLCSQEGCGFPVKARGVCYLHYAQTRRAGGLGVKPCSVEGCETPADTSALCSAHYQDKRSRQRGVPQRVIGRTDELLGYIWHVSSAGYLSRRETDPTTGKQLHILQHRAVMEDLLGRELLPGENVHHLNGHRDDNRIENLELWSTKQPKGQRVADKTAWAIEWLREYAPEKLC